MLEQFVALIAPHDCLVCGTEGRLLCAACAAQLPPAVSRCYRCQRVTPGFRTCTSCQASPLRAVRAVTPYQGVAKALIWRLKFGRAQAAARDIALLLQLPPEAGHARLLVHVPTATSRVRQRGYDQARLIARRVSALHGIAYVPALVRHGQQRQVGMSGEARREQLRGAFRVALPKVVSSKHVILIDDVLTSGASLESAAAALKQAGAWRVDACVFAQA